MNQPNQDSHHNRGRRHKGKGREENTQVFTLEEWERSKSSLKPSIKEEFPDISRDEDLAWQLQNQFDLEESHHPVRPNY